MHTELLESRRLFAGVTLITHGLNGDVTGWVARVADGTQGRAGGANAASIYTMRIAAGSRGLTVTDFAPDSGEKDYRKTTAGELIIKLDWNSVSNGNYTTGQVAEVASNYLLTAPRRGPALAELPLHLIGHSRGASLVVAMSQHLGRAGVWVDQVTSLDPHPVDGERDVFGVDYGDAEMATYDNVAFADDYWRTDGNVNNFDFDGESVEGTFQGNLNNIVQTQNFGSAHLAVTAYYVGTVDTDTVNGGEHPVIPSWYGSSSARPARTDTGYAFSRVVGTERPSSGVSTLLGGRGRRSEAGESGSQWGNVINLTSRGSRSVVRGQTIDLRFQYADRDDEVRVEVFADRDTNPYNGVVASLRTGRFGAADLAAGRIKASTGDLAVGSYRIATRVTDADGHTRWIYSPRSIRVTQPNFATRGSDGVVTVTGTDAADRITVSNTDVSGSFGSIVTLTLNGAMQTFNTSELAIGSVAVLAGEGNDTVDASNTSIRTYVNAGPGFDNVTGGLGSDTLSGGAQSDTLTGNLGDDVLNGNGGNNMLRGSGGYDRLYSADGAQDTMNGGSNADRFFGGNGNDYMEGFRGNDKMYGNGGNDTIIGGEGTDIVNGGTGRDSADDDGDDLRTDIEVILTA